MGINIRKLQYFFTSENFTDALRVTFGILLPALVLAQLGYLKFGVMASIGALSVSISDVPGPIVHKRNGMLYTCLAIFVVAFLTGLARTHVLLLGAEILLFSFFFSMFPVFGNRAAALGTAALLIMVLVMDEIESLSQVPLISAMVCAGGVWYMLLSLLFYSIRPYTPVQQALGECVHEVAAYMGLRALFYKQGSPLDEIYKRLVAQQILVNEKQEAVRELLFKSRQIVKESTTTSRKLLLTFVDLVDLYEQVMVVHYDYASLRERFGATGILETVGRQIEYLADVLDRMGYTVQTNGRPQPLPDLLTQLDALKQKIDALGQSHPEESVLALKKILVNLRSISQRISAIHHYYQAVELPTAIRGSGLDLGRFVQHQSFDLRLLLNHLNLQSTIFKHALRVALACLAGFVLTKLLPYGEHSYWVLLTIIVILKPAFSLSKQRNYHRLLGTLMGGVIGFCILLLIRDPLVLFGLLVLFMIGTFSFIRTNYIVSVIFMTPFVLIIFSFLGGDNLNLVQERVIDTLMGSGIAFLVSYLIFPSWESEQLQRFMHRMLAANSHYLQKLADGLAGVPISVADYKLARKEVYVSSANLSAAFQRMLSEPRSKQRNSQEVHKFVVLNHILSSNIATLASVSVQREYLPHAKEYLKLIKRSLAVLKEACKQLGPVPEPAAGTLGQAGAEQAAEQPDHPPGPEEKLLQEQLTFIYRLSSDIRKSTEAILA